MDARGRRGDLLTRHLPAVLLLAALLLITLKQSTWARPGMAQASPRLVARCHSLSQLASRRHWFWGSALDLHALSDERYLALLRRHVTVITPENALKWETLQPTPEAYDFQAYQQILQFTAESGMQLRGHALVWHRQLPGWLLSLSPEQRQQRLKVHIERVMATTHGRIQSWDVINEPLAADGRGLRRSLWLQDMGAAYIAKALRWAHAADPGVQLVINDYGLEGDDPVSRRKRQTLMALVRNLRAQHVPLDAIGMQAHLRASRHGPTFQSLPAFIAQLRLMGLSVIITELDINDADLPADVPARDHRVADLYLAFLEALASQPSVQGVIQWGLSDRYSWLDQFAPRRDGLPQRGLLFDQQLLAKPALSRLCQRLWDRP